MKGNTTDGHLVNGVARTIGTTLFTLQLNPLPKPDPVLVQPNPLCPNSDRVLLEPTTPQPKPRPSPCLAHFRSSHTQSLVGSA